MANNEQHTLLGQCIAEFIGAGLLIFLVSAVSLP